MAGFRLRKNWENGQLHSTGVLWSHYGCDHSLLQAGLPQPCPVLGTLDPDNPQEIAKLHPRWTALTLGERAAWSSLLPRSVDAHWSGLAYSNPAGTTWCSHFLSWEKRKETRLRPLWEQQPGLPHQAAPLMAFLLTLHRLLLSTPKIRLWISQVLFSFLFSLQL